MHFSSAGYIIHQKKSKEASLIFSIFTKKYGKISAIAPASLSLSKKNRSDFFLLCPLQLEFVKKSTYTLAKAQSAILAQGQFFNLCMNKQLAGLYLNELLEKCLEEETPYEALYDIYHSIFSEELTHEDLRVKLRCFEWSLLEQLGYSIHFPPIICNKTNYFFIPKLGAILSERNYFQCAQEHESLQTFSLSGETVADLRAKNFRSDKISKQAKIIFLAQLQWHSALKTIHSLQLFSQWNILKGKTS